MRLKSALRYLIFLFEIDTLLGAKVTEANSNADTPVLLRKHAPLSLRKVYGKRGYCAIRHRNELPRGHALFSSRNTPLSLCERCIAKEWLCYT